MNDGAVSESKPAGHPAEPGPAGPSAVLLLGRVWRGFRSWRRNRPFWAGVFLIVAGVELLTIPLPMHSMGLILHIGTGGVLGILIGAILIVCALLLWFNPAQRIFYSIVAILLAVAALVASNLGGFLIGTLLGVVGGSLGFAWMPERGDAVPDADLAGPRGGNGMVLSGIPVIPILGGVLALLNLGTGGSGSPAGAGASSSPTPAASSCPATSPGPSPSPTPIISVSIGITLGTNASPCPSSSPTPEPSPSASPSPTPSPSPSPTGGGHPGHSPSPKPSTGSSKSPGHRAKSGAAKRAGNSPGVNVASTPASLTAASAVITGFAYDGLATVHTAKGQVRMMQFSMSSLSLTGVELTVSQDGAALTTRAPTLDLSGKVVLYATRLSGDLLGVPVTITPQSPLATILRVIAPLTRAAPVPMTNVVTDQPYTSAGSMSVSGLQIS
jgi:Family of unknown function (DUF6114)